MPVLQALAFGWFTVKRIYLLSERRRPKTSRYMRRFGDMFVISTACSNSLREGQREFSAKRQQESCSKLETIRQLDFYVDCC